jgi:hypothetical protein
MSKWKSEYGLLQYNQLEILTLEGKTDKIVLEPNSLTFLLHFLPEFGGMSFVTT